MQCLKKSVSLKEIKKIKNKNDSREIQIYDRHKSSKILIIVVSKKAKQSKRREQTWKTIIQDYFSKSEKELEISFEKNRLCTLDNHLESLLWRQSLINPMDFIEKQKFLGVSSQKEEVINNKRKFG